MIQSYIDSIKDIESVCDESILKELVSVYKEIDGQYCCITYNYDEKIFKDFSTSGDFKLGEITKHFKLSWQPEFLKRVIFLNKKKKFFKGSNQIKLYFKYNGVRMSLVDVWSEKEGFIKPKDFNNLFCIPDYIESSKLIDVRVLDSKFIKSNSGLFIKRIDGTKIKL